MNFPIAMTSRQEPARSLRWLSPALALLLTVVAGAVIFAALGKAGINIRMISQGPDELNIIVGVNNDDFESCVRVLYNSFVK